MACVFYLSGINLAGSIQSQRCFSEWRELEANQAVMCATDGTAVLLAGASLARGLWSNWKQEAGNFFDKMCVGVSQSDETSLSYMQCVPKLELGMVFSISRGEKSGSRRSNGFVKCVQAESVGFSSLQWSQAQGVTARGVGPPCPSTLARPLTRCQDPPCTAWWCVLPSDVMPARAFCPARGILEELPVGSVPSSPPASKQALQPGLNPLSSSFTFLFSVLTETFWKAASSVWWEIGNSWKCPFSPGERLFCCSRHSDAGRERLC